MQVTINLLNFAGHLNLSYMDYRFLLRRIRYIILDPAMAWDSILSDEKPIEDVRNSFFIPFIIAASIAAFLGSVIFTNSGLSVIYSLLEGIKHFLLLYFVIYSSSFILKEITYALDLGRDFNLSFKLIVYSTTPFFICHIVSLIFESFIFVNILSLYGLYIFWLGTEKMLNPPDHKKMPMVIATFITMIGLFIAANLFLTAIVEKFYYAFFA
jgi:hypothetical protein